MQEKIELLAIGRSIDEIAIDFDIESSYIIGMLIDEKLIDLEFYFGEEESKNVES